MPRGLHPGTARMRQAAARLCILFLPLLLLSACGEPPQTVAPDAILDRGNGPEPETLDPHRSRGDSAANVLRDLYEGLVAETPTGQRVPGAAAEWTISEDGRVYTFRIRKTARWSNGDPVTAADFVAGLRRSVNPDTGSHYATVLYVIENARAVHAGELPPEALGVQALDARTLRIRLESPTAYFLDLLTHHSTYPVHRGALAEHGEAFARPGRLIGNGAYRLVDWVVQSHITLERNPYYWDDARTAIDTVRFWHISDESAELQRYRANELDHTYTIPGQRYAWLRDKLGDELRIASYLSTYFYGLNLTRPPFANAPGLRRALSMVIDRATIAGKVMGQGQLPAWGFVPPGIANYDTQQFDYAQWPEERRREEARRLYAAAGYGPDNPLLVEIRYNAGEVHERVASAVAAMWREALGVRSRLVAEEFKVFLQNRQQMAQTQVFRSGWVADYNDASSFLDILRSNSGINDTGYANPEYDALLEAAQRESDPERREILLERAERLMLEAHPVMPLYFYVSRHLVKPWLGGWADHPLDRHYSKDLYFRRQGAQP